MRTKSISHKLPLGRKLAMKKLFNLVILIFMLSVIEKGQMVKVVEGRFCWSPSRSFQGMCIIHRNCAATCEHEGFETGECKGIIDRRCMCGGDCGGGGGNPPPEGGDFPPPEAGDTPPGGDIPPPEAGDTPPGGDIPPPEGGNPPSGGDFPPAPDEGPGRS